MKLLQMRFPGARVLWMDAARLATERLYDGAPVGAVEAKRRGCSPTAPRYDRG